MEQAKAAPRVHPQGKLRVLALHSFRTSANIFRQQFQRAQMIERLGSMVDVVFLDAPHPASGVIPRDVAPFWSGPYYEWFTVETMGDKLEYDADKLNRSVQLVARTLKEQGPFDGLVGFSQGTAMASTIAALQAAGDPLLQDVPPLSFVVLFAGFRPRYPGHAHAWQSKLRIPSLHVFGDRDELRPQCKELADHFENPVVIQHTRGHSIPVLTTLQAAVFQAFLLNVKQQASPAQGSRLTIPATTPAAAVQRAPTSAHTQNSSSSNGVSMQATSAATPESSASDQPGNRSEVGVTTDTDAGQAAFASVGSPSSTPHGQPRL